MQDLNHFLILRLVFTAFYGGAFSALLSRANIWYAFTPTFTNVPGKWTGWQDAFRWALAGLFLLLLPAIYFIYIQLGLSLMPQPFSLNLTPPSLKDLFKILVILSCVIPQLGFYNIWQTIVRSMPKLFYSDKAIKTIEGHYPNAFKFGYGTTIAWGFGWIFVPTLAFIFLLAIG